jgi:5-(aminomethyl)-3-furanmethanol phosphate kinase
VRSGVCSCRVGRGVVAVIAVKVGGSLFDHPRLGPGLRAYLESLAPSEVVLIPGGGNLAETVRKLDRLHGLGDEASHWLALQTMTVTAAFLSQLVDLPAFASRVSILDVFAFAREDEWRPGALPHSWDVTSDSIAARVAVVTGAERLILLKSIDIPLGTSWTDATERGWVDRHFPHIIATAAFPVETVNFSRHLDASLP